MKKTFSRSWLSSKQPRKQRKYRYNAPQHVAGKFLSATLSKDLRKKYSRRSIRVRKGDKVKILRGRFRGKDGKVERVDLKHTKVFVEKLEISKKDGSKALYPLEPSNLMITELTEDKRRVKTNESTS